MTTEHFTLTRDHITLLTNVYISWDYCEYGASCIDPKRPYGNGDVRRDMAELLDRALEKDEARELHQETQTALQVILDTQSFAPGAYERERYGGRWKSVQVSGQDKATS